MLDCIIIGKGPAGLSAGIYTSMANVKTLIIGKDSLLQKSEKIQNYFGFEEIIDGQQLLQRGIKQAIATGCEVLNDMVIAIDILDNGFNIVTAENGSFNTKSILLATGNNRNTVHITNLEKFEGKGISYCTTCDGFFFKNKKVGVIGSTDYTIHEANELLSFTENITILTNGNELKSSGESNNTIKSNKIVSFEGENKLEHIVYDNGEKEQFDGIFIAQDYPTASDFIKKLGLNSKNRLLTINDQFMTNIRGIFAAGDIVNDFKQISTAVGSGANSAKNIIKYCKE
ncbi:MAG: NAD(P)/FAD-dependent oxidoreductase [Bacilli bacterium]